MSRPPVPRAICEETVGQPLRSGCTYPLRRKPQRDSGRQRGEVSWRAKLTSSTQRRLVQKKLQEKEALRISSGMTPHITPHVVRHPSSNIVHICFLRRVPSKEGLAGDLRETKNLAARCQRSVRCETGSSRSLTVQSEVGREPARKDPQASGAKQAHTPWRTRESTASCSLFPPFSHVERQQSKHKNIDITRSASSVRRGKTRRACIFLHVTRTRLRWRTTHILTLAKRWASS